MVAGIDVESGAGVLDRCGSTEEAARELAVGPGTVWAVVLTLENATIAWRELNRTLLIGDPLGLRRIRGRTRGTAAARSADVPAVRRAHPPRRLNGDGYCSGAVSVPSGATSTPWVASCSRTRNWNVDQAPRRASNMR